MSKEPKRPRITSAALQVATHFVLEVEAQANADVWDAAQARLQILATRIGSISQSFAEIVCTARMMILVGAQISSHGITLRAEYDDGERSGTFDLGVYDDNGHGPTFTARSNVDTINALVLGHVARLIDEEVLNNNEVMGNPRMNKNLLSKEVLNANLGMVPNETINHMVIVAPLHPLHAWTLAITASHQLAANPHEWTALACANDIIISNPGPFDPVGILTHGNYNFVAPRHTTQTGSQFAQQNNLQVILEKHSNDRIGAKIRMPGTITETLANTIIGQPLGRLVKLPTSDVPDVDKAAAGLIVTDLEIGNGWIDATTKPTDQGIPAMGWRNDYAKILLTAMQTPLPGEAPRKAR